MSVSKTTQEQYKNHQEEHVIPKSSSKNTDLGYIINKMLETIKMNSKENMDGETGIQFSRMTSVIVRMANQITE